MLYKMLIRVSLFQLNNANIILCTYYMFRYTILFIFLFERDWIFICINVLGSSHAKIYFAQEDDDIFLCMLQQIETNL